MNKFLQAEVSRDIESAIGKMTKQNAEITRMFYGIGQNERPVHEISGVLGIALEEVMNAVTGEINPFLREELIAYKGMSLTDTGGQHANV